MSSSTSDVVIQSAPPVIRQIRQGYGGGDRDSADGKVEARIYPAVVSTVMLRARGLRVVGRVHFDIPC